MKTKELPFNPEADAVLTYVPDFQETPFTITGLGENLLPIAQAVEREQSSRTVKHVTHVAKAAVEAVRSSDEVLQGHRATITAKLFDLTTGRNMYNLLKQKREDERDLLMAKRLGLITTDSCAKHKKALASIRGMR